MHHDVETVFLAHKARVYRWACAMSASHDDALDVVQEVFLRLVRNTPDLDNTHAIVGWLRRTTVRILIDHWRSASSRPRHIAGAPIKLSYDPPPEDCEALDRIRAAMQTISEQQRLVLVGKCYDSMTFAQIASELGIGIPTAKTHYLRALTAVRDTLQLQSGRTA